MQDKSSAAYSRSFHASDAARSPSLCPGCLVGGVSSTGCTCVRIHPVRRPDSAIANPPLDLPACFAEMPSNRSAHEISIDFHAFAALAGTCASLTSRMVSAERLHPQPSGRDASVCWECDRILTLCLPKTEISVFQRPTLACQRRRFPSL